MLGWTAPRHRVPQLGCQSQPRTVRMKYKRIAIDTSKHVFTLHGVDELDRPILRRNLKRAEMEAFFGKLAPTEVVMEACGRPSLGPAAEPPWPSGASHPGTIRQTLRQASQERSHRRRRHQRRGLTTRHARGAG